MSGILDWLFGVRELSFGGAEVAIDFARPVPAWGWLLIVASAFVVSAWSYSRLEGRLWGRWVLAGLRGMLIVLLAVLISGPRLSQQTQSVERDSVVVLLDRSGSMGVVDAGAAGSRVSRDQQMKEILRGTQRVWGQLAADRSVVWMGFDGSAVVLDAATGGAVPELGEAVGRRTSLGPALEQALRRTAARPVAGVVVMSDGRTSEPASRAVLDQLRGRQIPVFVVPLGSQNALADLAVREVTAPAASFVGDSVPVSAVVARSGETSAKGTARARLVDRRSGKVLDERVIEFAADEREKRVSLTGKPDEAGETPWVVEIAGESADIAPGNDSAQVVIRLVDRPIRVVYFDGYPRWEYRYLKNLLVREKSVRSSVTVLQAQRRFLQEGSDPLAVIPRSAQEWREFDVVVIGDVRPEMFSPEQLAQIREHVSRDGGGILFVGGPQATPDAWKGTPLADLLPFSMNEDGGRGIPVWLEPVVVSPTPAADRQGLMRLSDDPNQPWPKELSEGATGWSALRYAQKIDPARVKPAAEVLAEVRPAGVDGAAATPVVLSMRFGAGVSMYVATDETWRWRYGRGEVLPERFWLPMLRTLARQGLAASGQAGVLSATPSRAAVDQPVQVLLRVMDQAVLDSRPRSLQARVTPRLSGGGSGSGGGIPTELRLIPQGGDGPDGTPPSLFSAAWIPTEAGTYDVEVVDPTIAGTGLKAVVEAEFSDDEFRVPDADHAGLAALAEATGGAVVAPERVDSLPGLLPNREVRLLGAPNVETLWDKPFVWVLLMVLACGEWVGRRLIRLS